MHSHAWSSLRNFRTSRDRNKRFVYGDQWSDPLRVGRNTLTEEEYYASQGHVPLKNNILRRILRNVVGLYRANFKVPELTRSGCGLRGRELKDLNRRRLRWAAGNMLDELAPRLFEEFLISGLVAVRTEGSKILPVTPDNFFFHSDGYDPRGWNTDLIGEVHHVSLTSLTETFCRTPDDYRRLREIYGESPSTPCRLWEVWRKETSTLAPRHVLPPLKCTFWRRRWYAPDGQLLRTDPPEAGHPYVYKAYPFIDGEIHSYIGDLIDQQKYVNRLITMYDIIMRASAKGVLLFPDESLPRGMTLDSVAEEWGRFNGVIPYHAVPGVPMPTQVSANSTNIGITDLLKIQMQMLEDISGVSPTLQGKLQTNSTSGALFAQQNEAAQTSLLDVIRSFDAFVKALMERCPTDIPSAKA